LREFIKKYGKYLKEKNVKKGKDGKLYLHNSRGASKEVDLNNWNNAKAILFQYFGYESQILDCLIKKYQHSLLLFDGFISKEDIDTAEMSDLVKKESHTIQKVEEKKIEKTENKPVIEKKTTNFNQNKGIIDKIIESDPGRIKLGNQKFFTPIVDAKQSLLENEHLVTETLAKIYALQGNNSKAIRAYEILSLKFPQKSVYFASLIEKLKNNK